MKYNIIIADDLSDEAIDLLRQSGQNIYFGLEELPNADALIVRSTKVTKNLIDQAPPLKIIARAGVGMDTIDEIYAHSKNIFTANAPGGNADNAAETTIGLMLSMAHNIVKAHGLLYHQKKWERNTTQGFELKGKTLGIIGCGNVGSRVAKISLALGMNILIYDPYITNYPENATAVSELTDLLPQCDLLTLHVPLTSETYHMISEKELFLLPFQSCIVNASRGAVVNEAALIQALNSGHIKSAALDVFENEPLPTDSPLFDIENIILLPHLGGASIEARNRVSIMAAEAVLDFLNNLSE